MRKIFALAIIAAVTISQPAHAASLCSGTITRSLVYSSGAVSVLGSWRNATTQVCNLKIEWKNITPDVCAAWLARIDAAVSLQRPIAFYFTEDLDCASYDTYNASPAPYYIQLQ